jgi:molybdopterin-guanine dinucleotide biosynthesis protein A
LQGLAAGLAAIAPDAPAAFVSSTDAPFLHPAFIRRLAALLDRDHDAVVPFVDGRLHPLAAVYGLAVRPAIDAMLAEGDLRLTNLAARVRTLAADATLLLAGAELAREDPELRSLRNVNTPAEYAAALAEGARR